MKRIERIAVENPRGVGADEKNPEGLWQDVDFAFLTTLPNGKTVHAGAGFSLRQYNQMLKNLRHLVDYYAAGPIVWPEGITEETKGDVLQMLDSARDRINWPARPPGGII